MNEPFEEQTEAEAKPAIRTVNNAWVRYPLLVVTILIVAVLTLKARELTKEILAAVGPVEEWFNLPF